jgi:hypothetical protein
MSREEIKEVTEKEIVQFPVEPTKEDLVGLSNAIMNSPTPLKHFIMTKALEKICKNVVDSKEFRHRVKEDFLVQTEGALDKKHIFGADISIRKAAIDYDLFEFSKKTEDLRKEIEIQESEIDLKKLTLKQRRDSEIVLGIAKKVTIDSLLEEQIRESKGLTALQDFNLTISFK